MFSHIRVSSDGTLLVYANQRGSARTSSFVRGTITLDTTVPDLQFKNYERLRIPDTVSLQPGSVIFFGLVDESGHLAKQSRQIEIPVQDSDGKLPEGVREPRPGVWVFTGTRNSPPRRPGKQSCVEKLRAYLDHPGVKGTSGQFPAFIEQMVVRQHRAWNRLCSLNQAALDQTSPYPAEVMREFVDAVMVPGIDTFNDSLGRSKDKIEYPSGMKRQGSKGDITRYPSYFRIRSFARRLSHLREEGKPYPPELLEQVETFIGDAGPIDYTEINKWKSHSDFVKQTMAQHSVIDLFTVDQQGVGHYSPPSTVEERERNTLRPVERATVVARYQAALLLRETTKCSIVDGWPHVKYNEPMKGDWTLERYGNGQEIATADLENGVTGVNITFGPPLPIEQTAYSHLNVVRRKQTAKQQAGRSMMVAGSRNARRKLRTVTIGYRDETAAHLWKEAAIEEAVRRGLKTKEAVQLVRQWTERAHRRFVLVIEQWRDLPLDSFVKGFKLTHRADGSLWLNLAVEKPARAATDPSPTAAVHLGWRKLDEVVQIATIYDPSNQRYSVVRVNLDKAPPSEEPHDSRERRAQRRAKERSGVYEINMGASRRSRRASEYRHTLFPPDKELIRSDYGRELAKAIQMATHEPAEYRAQFHKKAKKEQDKHRPYEVTYTAIDTHRSLAGLQTLRDIAKDVFRAYLFQHSGKLPNWARRAGIEDLHTLGQQSRSAKVQAAYKVWAEIDQQLGSNYSMLWKKVTARLEDNYHAVSHSIAQKLTQHGITRVAVANDFLKTMIEQDSNQPRIELSQKYRQWTAPGKFAKIFEDTAKKYGIVLVKVPAKGTTAVCAQCGAVNPPTGNRLVQCLNGACKPYDQDENAALNLSRAGDRLLFGDQVSA